MNLGGVFYCSKAALAPMMKAGKGAIVNVSSMSAHLGRKGGSPAYTTSKAGLIGLTANFSAQVADLGIRVNAVMPGVVEKGDFGWSEEERAAVCAQLPIGAGTPQDVGEAVKYLVSPAARWVTGTTLAVHGANSPIRASSV